MLLIKNKAPNTHSNVKPTHLEIAMTTKKSFAMILPQERCFHVTNNNNPRLSVVSPNGGYRQITPKDILPIVILLDELFFSFISFARSPFHFGKMSDVVVEPGVTRPLQVSAPESTEGFEELQHSEKKKRNSSFVAARASFTNSIEQQKHRGSITALPAGPHSPNGHFRLRSSFTEQSPSSSSSQNNNNKNWEQEILSQRKIGSVKDISSRFKGNSKIETMAAYEQRIRDYKNLKTINYFRLQNQDLKSLSLKNKIKIMNELKSMYLNNEKMGKLTTEAAKEFLSHHELSAENLSQEQWNEWLEVIENTVKEAAQERATVPMVASSVSQEEASNNNNSPLVLPIVSHDSLDNFDDEKKKEEDGEEEEQAPSTPTTKGDSKFNSLQELHVINSNNNHRPTPLVVNQGEEEKNNNNPNPNNNNNNQEISHSHYWSNSFLSPSKKTEFDSGVLDNLLFDEEQKRNNDENNENEKKEPERESERESEQQDDDRATVVRNPLTGSRIGTNLEEKKVHSRYRDSLSSTPPSSPPRSPLRENKKELISSSLSYQSVDANSNNNNKNNNNSHNNSSSSLLSASLPRSPSPSPQVTSKPAFVPLSVANRSSEADYHEMDNNGNASKKKKSPGFFFCCFRS
jgi:hypothetical protein